MRHRLPILRAFRSPLALGGRALLALAALGVGLLLAGGQAAWAAPQRVDAVEVELVARDAAVVPGRALQVALRIRHDPHWHTYWRQPGDSGLPTRIDWTLPAGWQAGEIRWPAPSRLLIGPLANYGYEGEVLLPVLLTVPPGLSDESVLLRAQASWLVCKDVCIPGEAALELRLPVQAAGEPPPSRSRGAIDATLAALPSAGPTAVASIANGRLGLVFAADGVRRAEFFPYEGGRVAAAAPQDLERVGGGEPARLRLSVPVADGADPAAWLGSLGKGRAIGVLRLDDRAFELTARAGAPSAEAGEPIARAEGRQVLATAGSRDAQGGGGLLDAARRAVGSQGPASAPVADGGVAAFAIAIAFAMLGGLILNLMPCVFPVIGLKVSAFAGASPRQARRGAIAFTAGVLATFLLLAGLLLALRSAGEAVGWGFQLQSPVFVVLLALLFVLLALNFAGVVSVGTALTRLGGHEAAIAARAGRDDAASLAASFGSGVLAVLVATPCTAPFMGSALGFTLGQPAPVVLAVFAAVALGMALPYGLLALVPSLVERLPRPGPWMESLRQFMAFPMLASAAWLAWVLAQQAGADALLGLMLGAVMLGLAAWILGRFVPFGRGLAATLPARLLSVAVAIVGLWLALDDLAGGPVRSGATAAPSGGPAAAPGDASASQAAGLPAEGSAVWAPWSRTAVDAALARGQPVFVDITAAWCVSCQANKRLVLDRASVREAFERAGVVRLRADWTQRDPAITEELARHGRNGVPLYLLYAPGAATPRILPELLSTGLMIDALAGLR